MKRLLFAVAALTLISAVATPSTANADNDRRGWKNTKNYHDWDKKKHWHDDNHRPKKVFYYSPTYYQPPRSTVVYYNTPSSYYYNNGGTYFSQTQRGPTTYTETYYPDGSYARSYVVGGYLPKNRHWRPMNDYVRFGLPAPRRGERWVYEDRDAVLISEATSRIISGVLLAAAVR
ncbi:MAG: hypothetical protein DI586_09380 [Micavibrio aeruginosavorus]|uniref:RcnB family protein n=1 Tax=Micavibrio aeruginosavorus TaxID=349221 RepID=A0A2W5HLF5_9BACT|nr:MAG: hypothetical protein DI586_09380 [Micavibrio aeruginosavorus]